MHRRSQRIPFSAPTSKTPSTNDHYASICSTCYIRSDLSSCSSDAAKSARIWLYAHYAAWYLAPCNVLTLPLPPTRSSSLVFFRLTHPRLALSHPLALLVKSASRQLHASHIDTPSSYNSLDLLTLDQTPATNTYHGVVGSTARDLSKGHRELCSYCWSLQGMEAPQGLQ